MVSAALEGAGHGFDQVGALPSVAVKERHEPFAGERLDLLRAVPRPEQPVQAQVVEEGHRACGVNVANVDPVLMKGGGHGAGQVRNSRSSPACTSRASVRRGEWALWCRSPPGCQSVGRERARGALPLADGLRRGQGPGRHRLRPGPSPAKAAHHGRVQTAYVLLSAREFSWAPAGGDRPGWVVPGRPVFARRRALARTSGH